MLYIGIDLGTSAVKLLLVNELGEIIKEISREYPVSYPHSGWSEQNPEDWWNAVLDGVKALITDADKTQIAGIGCGGQMHGLVVLDENDKVIRPAILWNDGRTSKDVEYLNNVICRDVLSENTANIAFAGFTAPFIISSSLTLLNSKSYGFFLLCGFTFSIFSSFSILSRFALIRASSLAPSYMGRPLSFLYSATSLTAAILFSKSAARS